MLVHHEAVGDKAPARQVSAPPAEVHHEAVGDKAHLDGGQLREWLQAALRDVGPAELVQCHLRGTPATLANRMFFSRMETGPRGRRRVRKRSRC